jgi:hypothetical protein
MFIPSFLLSFVRPGGLLAGAGQPREVAAGGGDDDDVGRGEVRGDLPGRAVRLVSQAVVAVGQAAF